MVKNFQKQSFKESLKKPVTKSITKLQKLKKFNGKVKMLKKKATNGEKQYQEENNEYESPQNEVVEDIRENQEPEVQDTQDVPQDGEGQQQEDFIQLENEKEDDESAPAVNRPSSNIIKVLKPMLESKSIYTGGRILLSSENDLVSLCSNEIVIFSLETQTVRKKLTQENEEIANFVLHPSGKSIVYFTKNYLLRHVLIEDNSVQRLWKVHNQYILDMAIDATGRFLAAGFANGVIQVFDLKNGNTTHMFSNNKGAIVKLEFHPQPQKLYLISIAEDLSLKFYDLVINNCVQTFREFQNAPSSFTILDDGINIFTSSFDLKINLYDIQEKKFRTSFSTGTEEIATIENIKLTNPKTKEAQTFLLIGGQTGVLKSLNLALKEPVIQSHEYIKSEAIIKIMKFKKGRKIAVVTAEQNVIILGYSLNAQGEIEFKIQNQIPGYNDEIIDIKFIKRRQEASPKSLDYYAYCTNSSQIRVYFPQEKSTSFLWGHEDIVLCLDTYGNYIASGAKDNSIKLWRYEDGAFKLLSTFKGHNESVGTLAFAPVKGNYIVSGSADKTLKLWSIGLIKKKTDGPTLEDVTSAKSTIIAHDKDINCVKFSPNEKLIVSASQDRSIKLFQTQGLKLQMVLKGHKRGVWDVAFSPVEKVLASASGDNTIKLWNLADGTCIKTLEGHEAPVLKVDWIAYGLEIVSSSADGLMKVWNVKKMVCVNTADKHEGKLWSMAVRQNTETGKYEVLTGDNNSTWILWEDQTKEEEQAKKENLNKQVVQNQQLFSLIRENKHFEAGKLAFDLKMTKHFKQAVETLLNKAEFKTFMLYVVEEDEGGDMGEDKKMEDSKDADDFRKLVEYCLEKDMKRLLITIRDLNTSSKYSRIAQRMLEIFLENVNFEDMDEMKRKYNAQEGDKNLQGLLEVLLAYSERHFTRVQKYVTKSYYLDYIMKQSFLVGSNQEKEIL